MHIIIFEKRIIKSIVNYELCYFQEILLFNTKEHINKVDFLKEMPIEVITAIVCQLHSEIFLPGDIIVKAGSAGSSMFFITCGTLAVTTAAGQEVNITYLVINTVCEHL